MSEKIYCGTGKKITFQDGGSLIKLLIGPNDLQAINQWAQGNNGWTNIKVCSRREPDQRGNTHYLEIDQWKPESQQQPAQEFNADESPF